MFVPTTSIIFGWVLSHFFIGAQRLFLVLTIISSVQEYHQIEETKHLTCCDKLYAEQPYKSPHDGATVQGIRRLGGLIHGLERRTPNGVVQYRIVKTLLGYSVYEDSNEDGRWDRIELHKNYVGLFRLPDSEFDQHFGKYWRNGVSVKLKDSDKDGCFEKKTLIEENFLRDRKINTKFTDADCDASYEATQTRVTTVDHDYSLHDHIILGLRDTLSCSTHCP